MRSCYAGSSPLGTIPGKHVSGVRVRSASPATRRQPAPRAWREVGPRHDIPVGVGARCATAPPPFRAETLCGTAFTAAAFAWEECSASATWALLPLREGTALTGCASRARPTQHSAWCSAALLVVPRRSRTDTWIRSFWRRRFPVEPCVFKRPRVLDGLDVREHRRVRQAVTKGCLDLLCEVVSVLDRPVARDEDVH